MSALLTQIQLNNNGMAEKEEKFGGRGMNKILFEIKKRMIDCIEKYIPDISFSDLEDNGAIIVA